MATTLTGVEVGTNWKWVQISGIGDATFANSVSFLRPVTIRRVVANTSSPVGPFIVYHSFDGTSTINQQTILAQNCDGEAAQSLIHDSEFSLHLPQLTATKSSEAGGSIYFTTTGLGGGTWTLSIEAKE